MCERAAPGTSPDGETDETIPAVTNQDLEHDARPETRVNDAGVEVKPKPKDPGDASTEVAPSGDAAAQ